MGAVSASKSALLLSPCIRWTWSGAKAYESEFANTEKRDKGTLFHSAMDRYYREGGDKWLKVCSCHPEVCGWVRLAIAWSREHLEPRCETIHSEVYVGTNFATGESVRDDSVKDRKYPDMPGFVPGTTDLVVVLATGELLVADWKTGGGTGADKQLLSLAVGLRKLFLLPDGTMRPVRLSVLYANAEGVRPHEWAVTDEELEAHRVAMAFQLADVGVRKEAVPGTHCHNLYCGHLAHCPGIGAIVEDAAESPEGLLPANRLARKFSMDGEFISDKHAGYVMSRVTSAKRQLDYHAARVKKHLANGGKCVADDLEFSNGTNGHRWRPIK